MSPRPRLQLARQLRSSPPSSRLVAPHSVALRAAKDVPPFQCLLSVPLRLCLAVEEVSAGGSAKLAAQLLDAQRTLAAPPSSPPAGSAARAASLLDSQPLFSQYLGLLPDSAHLSASFPSHWSSRQWRGLENSTLHHLHKTRRAEVLSHYEERYPPGSSGEQLEAAPPSLEKWRWADEVLGSRSFGVGGATALVPLMDLLDHCCAVTRQPLGSSPGCMVVSVMADGLLDVCVSE